MRIQIQAWFIFFLLFFFIQEGHAQITLPKVFGDSMVLQRGIKIPVWGSASPGQHIIAALGKFRATAIADHAGQWKLHFPVLKAGGPYALSISETGKPNTEIKLKGILIGDVWLASGQSNMEWSVQQSQDAASEIANADFSQIRFLQVAHDKKITPQSDILNGKWKVCNP